MFEGRGGDTGVRTLTMPVATLRLRVEFQWFLMLLSVRPGRWGAILAHLLPYVSCCSARMRSSSALHSPFFMEGSRWLCHLRDQYIRLLASLEDGGGGVRLSPHLTTPS